MVHKLIVGDIVMYKKRIHTIINIIYTNSYELSYGRHPVGLAVLFGVPLTPEILEKNGWMKLNKVPINCTILYKSHQGLTIGYNINSKTFIYDFGVNLQRKIKFIHQLQHLLFGLGLNSEMEV